MLFVIVVLIFRSSDRKPSVTLLRKDILKFTRTERNIEREKEKRKRKRQKEKETERKKEKKK
jgi:hypothetical protein